MPRPKAHCSVLLKNHETGEQLKLELIDLPFASTRTFRLRVNGRWARKVPVASKTTCCGSCGPGGWRIDPRRDGSEELETEGR